MKQIPLVLLMTFFLLNNMHAQESCKVSGDALQGSYTGDCKDGRANGKGKATGTDSFEGEFKNGYPDGEGVYTWSNKDVYKGTFKKGILEGKGEIRYFTKNGKDSVLTGFWKKNKYFGQFERPYIINDKTSKTNRVEVSLVKKGDNTGSLTITSSQLSESSNQLTDGASQRNTLIPSLTDITVIAGEFVTQSVNNLAKSSVAKVQQMKFPFRARLSFSNGETVEITFNERADYDVAIAFL
ncbi:MAG: hypothetical protein EOP47_28575 [Sphingobacteriaceae bacterium]|nr:MAG: hypothetical protein EOP47_28575 [Sphingobacteriaceae bacterium]